MYGGFEYAAREARRELLEEAERWRLAGLARPDRGFRERVRQMTRFLGSLWRSSRPRVGDGEVPVGGTPSSVYLMPGDGKEAGQAVEVYVGGGGRVVRRTDLATGTSSDSFLVDGRVRPWRSG